MKRIKKMRVSVIKNSKQAAYQYVTQTVCAANIQITKLILSLVTSMWQMQELVKKLTIYTEN